MPSKRQRGQKITTKSFVPNESPAAPRYGTPEERPNHKRLSYPSNPAEVRVPGQIIKVGMRVGKMPGKK